MYMTPGSVAEMLYFFVAEYRPEQRVNNGGGLAVESEDIEVIEIPLRKLMTKYVQVKSKMLKQLCFCSMHGSTFLRAKRFLIFCNELYLFL